MLLQSLLDTVIIWMIGSTIYDYLENADSSNRKTAAGSAALLYALSPIVIVRSINGLETTLTALFLVLWLRTFLTCNSDREKGNSRTRWVWLGLVTGLLLLARTDSFIILVPLYLYAIFTWRPFPINRLVISLLIAIGIVVPWLIWNAVIFGSPLQSSAEAVPFFAMKKYDVLFGPFGKYIPLLFDTFKNILKPFLYSTFCISLITIVFSIGTYGHRLTRAHRTIYLLLAGCLLLLTIHTIFRGFVREWYVEQMVPVFLIGYGISIAINISPKAQSGNGRWRLVIALLVLQGIFFMSAHYESQKSMVDRGIPTIERLTLKSRVASFNSGYYGYFANRAGSAVNLDGVVNSNALRAIKAGDLHGYLNRDSIDYILDFKGDFGGFHGLIDSHILDDFYLDSTIETSEKENPLLLYGRRNALP